MTEKAARYRIVYALEPKKVQSFIQPSLLNHAKERGIDLVPIEPTKPLIEQLPFDCLIHKLSSPDWIDQLQQFLSQHPNAVIIDPPAAIERLHNRITMLQVINELKITHQITLGSPNQVFVESPDPIIDPKGVAFPVIAKPLAADGSAGCHQMFLVFDQEGLGVLGSGLRPPFVLQEFVNHGGVVFKVYVAGEHVRCVKRRSLPDISEGKLGAVSESVVPFSRVSNLTDQDQSDEGVEELIEAAELPPVEFVDEVARELRLALKLNLFNFDMIRDGRVGDRYLVIDLNYFPGYAKVPGYETMLTDFFLDVVQRKQKTGL